MEDVKPAKLLQETMRLPHKEMEKTIPTPDHPANKTVLTAKILLIAGLTTTLAGKALLVAVRLKRKTRLMRPKPVS